MVGDLSKKTKIRPKKRKDQNVSLARDGCHLSLWKLGFFNLPGVEGKLSRWDICFIWV